jgi:hypothetical protein
LVAVGQADDDQVGAVRHRVGDELDAALDSVDLLDLAGGVGVGRVEPTDVDDGHRALGEVGDQCRRLERCVLGHLPVGRRGRERRPGSDRLDARLVRGEAVAEVAEAGPELSLA